MNEHKIKSSSKAGLPPGSIVYVGKEKTSPVKITEFNFSPDNFEETELSDISESKTFTKEKSIATWVNIDGVHSVDKIESIGRFFNLDQMVLEDAVNTNGRPKFEDLEDYLFLSMKMLQVSSDESEIVNEQLSLILGENYVLSIDENENDIFRPYLNRLRNAKGTSRKKNEAFIFYRIIDIVVDNYFQVTEFMSDEIENLEDKIIENTDETLASEIYELKKKIGQVKKAIVPLREAISAIIRSDSELISEETRKYFRDVYEHVQQVTESVDSERETVNDFLNLYMSGLSNKMNEVMKVLTIFSAVFIPLTFIAGVYGMNFEIIPELKWKYGYFITWGFMIVIAAILLNYFRRKKWL